MTAFRCSSLLVFLLTEAACSAPDASASVDGAVPSDAGGWTRLKGWADGGDFEPTVAKLELFGPPSNISRGISINRQGTMLAEVLGADGGGALGEGQTVLISADGTYANLSAMGPVNPIGGAVADDESAYVTPIRSEPTTPAIRRFADGGQEDLPFVILAGASSSGVGWATGLLLPDLRSQPGEYAVMRPDGGLIRLGPPHRPVAVNSAGVAVGQMPVADPTAMQGVRWRVAIYRDGDAGTLPLAPAVEADGASCISDSEFIGGFQHKGSLNLAAVWYDGTVAQLPRRRAAESDSALVTSVSNLGVAVGHEDYSNGAPANARTGWAFVWARGQYFLLDDLVSDAGLEFETAASVNDSNQIAGRVRADGGSRFAYRLSLSVDSGGW